MTDRLVKASPTWKTTLSLLAGALALSLSGGSPALARVVEESGQEIPIRVSRGSRAALNTGPFISLRCSSSAFLPSASATIERNL